MPKRSTDPNRVVTENRRARHEYAFLDQLEAGLVLRGSEVKSLRAGQGQLTDAYVTVCDGEAWLVGAHIPEYSHASLQGTHTPRRDRKLLLHRGEIARLARQVAEKGLTLVPYRIYFKDGRAKCAVALARGKTGVDKRRTIAERDANREMARELRGRELDRR